MKQQNVVDFSGFSGWKTKRRERLAVILAGGEGARLRALTRVVEGDDRPKQFCRLLAGETLLDATRRRVARAIAPENVYFSLTARHERFYRPLLAGAAPQRLVVQPENKGTAPAILYSLLRLAAAAPAEATVAFFPSDHYFSDDAALMRQTETAFRAAESGAASIVLLGIEPDSAEASYGWIEPAPSLFGGKNGGIARVRRFWEKPAPEKAARLHREGSLWNSFVMVGKVSAFLALFETHLPALYGMFAAASRRFGTNGEAATVRALYAWIEETNFSSCVLEKAAGELSVLRVGGIAWSDLGEPERVIGTLAALGVETDWMNAA